MRLDVIARPTQSTRLVALDVFRGLTMAAMVIVNNPGDGTHVYWPLRHAAWNGWTPTDLVFPFFLFIVGVSITLSRKTASCGGILRRTAIIFALGLFLNLYPRFDLETLRIPGVLQRIALCYGIAAALFHLTAGERRRQGLTLAAIAGGLAVAYWLVMLLVPAPGGAAGDLSRAGSLAAWLDRTLLPGHIYTPQYDPEGLLSTVPAVATTLIGCVAGLWLTSPVPGPRKAAGLAAAGVAGVLLGYGWNAAFPINKALWTSSYVALTAGLALLLLAASYWIIDVRGWRGWTKPFVILGSNAITLYVLSGLLVDTLSIVHVTGADGQPIAVSRWLYLHLFAPLASPWNASLLYACAHLAVLFAVLTWMYRRKLFLRV